MASYNKTVEDGWIVYRDKDGNIISKTKLASSGGSKKTLAQQTNMVRKAAKSAEKSWLEKGMELIGID